MCGIAGWFGQGLATDTAQLMSALRHRGPDGADAWRTSDNRAGLVHTRLAIIDLSDSAAQPMCWPSTHSQSNPVAWVAFNGEIYNYRELRSELEAAGETFETDSDTEVLLRLLVRQGAAALSSLAGMFALAFYDGRTDRGLLARDPFGIKPLYFARQENNLVFASELNVLRLMVPGTSPDSAAVRDTLLWGSVPEPASLLAGAELLPAGSFLEWEDTDMRVRRWYWARFGQRAVPADPVVATRAALAESVQRHLVSDVPVGVFLSGGVDSSAVLALAREALDPGADLRTFSIGFDDPRYDESAVARRTARHFGTHHTEWRMTAQDGRAELADYLTAMDQSSVDGFNTWCISKLARREGMKVVLSGLGGDEIFAGYGSFRQVPRFLRLHRRLGTLRPVLAAMLGLTPPASRWRRLAVFLRGPGTPLAAFHVQRGIFTEAEARELARSITGVDPGATDWIVDDLPEDPADVVSLLELTRYMCNQLLRDSDVFSMAHSLELRVPLVDARLFDTLAAIPAAVRLRQGKQLLLEAVPEIPAWVREQPKRGFRFPFEEWMQGDFGGLMAAASEQAPMVLGKWYRRWSLATVIAKC